MRVCVWVRERESAIEKELATCSLIIRHQMEEDVRGQKNRGNLFWPGAEALCIKATENVVFLFGFKKAFSGVRKALQSVYK